MNLLKKSATLDTVNEPEGWACFRVNTPRQDRDFDFVKLTRDSFKEWERAGAPWHQGHDSSKLGIATSIDPGTGKLAVWEKDGDWFAKCWFDLEDTDSRKVWRAIMTHRAGAASVAFFPTPTTYDNRDGRGKTFVGPTLSEISVVTVPSNSESTLITAKNFRVQADIEDDATDLDFPERPDTAARQEINDRYGTPATPNPLAALYSHARSERDYLDQLNEALEGHDLMGIGDYARGIEERMEQLRRLYRAQNPDGNLDEEAKAFETDFDESEMQPGEAGLVDQGRIPPEDEDPEWRQRGVNQGMRKLASPALLKALKDTERAVLRWKLDQTEAVLRAAGYM